MNLDKISSLACRLFFSLAFLMMALAFAERIVNFAGYTFLHQISFAAGRVLEFAVMFLVFVLALLLRQIRDEIKGLKKGNDLA